MAEDASEVGQKRAREEEEEPEVDCENDAVPDEEEYEDDDSDSDVEFILGPAAQSRRGAAPAVPAAPVAPSQSVPLPDAAESAAAPVPEGGEPASAETALSIATGAAPPAKGTLDIEEVGQFNGQPITSVVPQYLEEKPWRRPGADTSDYFNYGFDEFTWTAYCSRQDKLRANFTPQQMMQSMGMPMMQPMGMPMMPFGMPPPGMFPPQRQ